MTNQPMTIEAVYELLDEQVRAVGESGLSLEERDEALVLVGMYAHEIDYKAYGRPDEAEIRAVTDAKVCLARKRAKIAVNHDELRQQLPDLIRNTSKKIKI